MTGTIVNKSATISKLRVVGKGLFKQVNKPLQNNMLICYANLLEKEVNWRISDFFKELRFLILIKISKNHTVHEL